MKLSPFTKRAAIMRQWLLLTALAVIAFGVVPLAFIAGVEAAGVLFGLLLIALAIARGTLPVETLGALVVRRRGVDVAMLAFVGIAMTALSATSPNM